MNEQNNPGHGNDTDDHTGNTGRPDDHSRKQDKRTTVQKGTDREEENETAQEREHTGEKQKTAGQSRATSDQKQSVKNDERTVGGEGQTVKEESREEHQQASNRESEEESNWESTGTGNREGKEESKGLSKGESNRASKGESNRASKEESKGLSKEESKEPSKGEGKGESKEEMELRDEYGHRYLSPEAINAWRISGALGSLVYWIIPLIYGAVSMGAPGWPEWPSYVLGVLFLTYTLLEATVIPWIRWKRWRYHVDRNEIDLRRGLFIVIRTLIPVKRVQHVDTRQGPVYRQFGLASVTITTAGDTHEIPALSEPVADDLRNKISEYARVAREDL